MAVTWGLAGMKLFPATRDGLFSFLQTRYNLVYYIAFVTERRYNYVISICSRFSGDVGRHQETSYYISYTDQIDITVLMVTIYVGPSPKTQG